MFWNGLELPEAYYQDDAVYIINADCREVLHSLPDKSVDLVLTDPPYGIGFKYENYVDEPNFYLPLMSFLIGEANRLCIGMVFIWQAMKQCNNWHLWFPERWRIFAGIKNFTQFLPITIQYSWDPIIFWDNSLDKGKAIAGQRDYHIGNTAKYVAEKSLGHPCPRPQNTVEYLVSIASEPNNLILDPFLGSGTTAYCAKKLNRKCIGIEIEERYCEISAKRCSQSVMKLEV